LNFNKKLKLKQRSHLESGPLKEPSTTRLKKANSERGLLTGPSISRELPKSFNGNEG